MFKLNSNKIHDQQNNYFFIGETIALWLNTGNEKDHTNLEKRLWNNGVFRAVTDGGSNAIKKLVE